MSFLFKLKRHVQRRLPPPLQKKLQEVIYVILYRLSPARHQNFFNSGYAPASEWLTEIAPFDREPLQATLCDKVLWDLPRALDPEQMRSQRILEIGCGLGGGIHLAAVRYPQAEIVGIDVNRTAVSIAGRRLAMFDNVEVTTGNALDLPFESERFDFVFSIGAAGYVGMERFLAEAARVLMPGGFLCFSAGFTDTVFSEHEGAVTDLAAAAGLEVLEINDITANVFAAIDADVPRRRTLIERVPWPFRGYALAWADMPGSMRYQEYVQGRRLDYTVACRKRS